MGDQRWLEREGTWRAEALTAPAAVVSSEGHGLGGSAARSCAFLLRREFRPESEAVGWPAAWGPCLRVLSPALPAPRGFFSFSREIPFLPCYTGHRLKLSPQVDVCVWKGFADRTTVSLAQAVKSPCFCVTSES